MFYRKTAKSVAIDAVIYSALILLMFSILYPFYYLLINSLNALLTHGPSYIIPAKFTMANYRTVIADKQLSLSFVITILRTTIGIAVTVFNTAMCAYALRRKHLSCRNFYLALFTIPMFFNGGLVPGYLNLKMLGLLDSFLVYIIPQAFSFFYVIIFMTYFNDLPEALEESATIDGAGYFTSFFRIYIPVSLPVIATLSLFAGVTQWNSWFDTLFYTTNPKLMTLSAILMKIVRENNITELTEGFAGDTDKNLLNPEGIKFATMLLLILPITLLYPFLQRYFIKGIMIGSVKG